ncbi:MAG: terminase small subunit [Bacillota bacterium]
MTVGSRGGPRKLYEDPDEMQKDVNKYFDSITKVIEDADGNKIRVYHRPPTVAGLAVALDTNRSTLLRYQKEYGDEFHNIISRAKEKIEAYAAEELYRTKGTTRGVMFALTNNYPDWNKEQNVNINQTTQDITDMSEEERNKRIQELRNKLNKD